MFIDEKKKRQKKKKLLLPPQKELVANRQRFLAGQGSRLTALWVKEGD